MNSPLSGTEKQLVKLLQELDCNALWFQHVKPILSEGINWKTRRLFAELKSFYGDNSKAIRKAVGDDIANRIEQL